MKKLLTLSVILFSTVFIHATEEVTRWRFMPYQSSCWNYGLYSPPGTQGQQFIDTSPPMTMAAGSAISIFLQPGCCPTYSWQGVPHDVGLVWEEIYIPPPGAGWTLVQSTTATVTIPANCIGDTWYFNQDGSGIDHNKDQVDWCTNLSPVKK